MFWALKNVFNLFSLRLSPVPTIFLYPPNRVISFNPWKSVCAIPNLLGSVAFHWSMIALSRAIFLEKIDFFLQLTIPNHTMTRVGIVYLAPFSKPECELISATYRGYEFLFVDALLCLENMVLQSSTASGTCTLSYTSSAMISKLQIVFWSGTTLSDQILEWWAV